MIALLYSIFFLINNHTFIVFQNNQMRDPDPDWNNYDAVADRFDKIDKVIDLHGHIIGMALSPDNR